MKYYKQIDGLRFVAIFAVLLQHFGFRIGNRLSAGYYGVDLFFVISGFLITSILLNQTGSFGESYKKFLGRRALRIFPIYYLTVFTLYFLHTNLVDKYLLFYVTYTYNYAYVHYRFLITQATHFWTLCVEEQFYLLWPLIILGLRRKRTVLYALIIVIIVLSFAQMCFNIIPPVTPYNMKGVFPRTGSLCMGALGALLYKDDVLKNKILHNRWLEYGIMLLLLPTLVYEYSLKSFVLPVCSLFFIAKCVSGGFKTGIINTVLNHRLVIYLGAISYGIYVYHYPISYYINTYLLNEAFLDKFHLNHAPLFSLQDNILTATTFVVNSSVSILVAHLSYRFIEKPILRYKDKFFRY